MKTLKVLFSPQEKASFQQKITGNLSDTHKRELAKMDEEIMMAKKEQEYWQKEIDEWKQRLQNTSQAQDKGRTHTCVGTTHVQRTCAAGYSN